MKFTIEQKAFNQGISKVQRAVSSKNTMPILKGIYLKADQKKGLHLIGTDLELGIENWIPANIKEEGAIVLPSNYLTNIIRELPAQKINFQANLENFQAEIFCANSEFNINGFDPEEFPQLPEVNTPDKITISSENLIQTINEVKFSISTDESQPALTGALMEIRKDNIIMVSTNTYRLAYSKVNLSPENIHKQNDIEKIIIPGDTLNELSRLIPKSEEKIEILIDSNYTSFNFKEITVISRLIEGQFPNYEQVIPDEYNTNFKVDKNKLHQAVKRASLIAREDSNVISIATDSNILIINSVDSDAGKAHEEVEIEKEGPEQNISIDAGYLLDVFKIIDTEEISIDLIGPVNPLTIKKGNNYTYLIMPIRPDNE